MTEPPDDIDTWLARDVDPLAPPPGTFERIHRQARRRKLSHGLAAAAGAVVVIAGGVLIPAAATGLLGGGPAPALPAAAPPSSSAPATGPSPPPPPAAVTPLPPATAAAGSGLSTSTSGASVPANFQPTSITMIGSSVGAVLGQAGSAGHCGPPVASDCTSLAGTSDYGQTWYGISAPVTGAPDGATGAGQLRFLNLSDGWAFGPQLYATASGGRGWTQLATGGQRVTALEAAGDRAFAVLATCHGGLADDASGCSVFALYSTIAGSNGLTQVPLDFPPGRAAGAMGTPGQPSSASLAIAGDAADPEQGTGYLLAPSGAVLRGSVGGGAWRYAGQAPCAPGRLSATEAPVPTGAQLTIGAAGALLLNCPGSGLYSSAGGAQWTRVSVPPADGTATSLAATSSGTVLLASQSGLLVAAAPGGPWSSAAVAGGVPAGGFSYVGMTSATQGVAVPANAGLGEVFTSTDGGLIWTPHKVSG